VHQSGQKKLKNECDVRKDERVRVNEREKERKRNTRELRNKNKSDLLRWKKKRIINKSPYRMKENELVSNVYTLS